MDEQVMMLWRVESLMQNTPEGILRWYHFVIADSYRRAMELVVEYEEPLREANRLEGEVFGPNKDEVMGAEFMAFAHDDEEERVIAFDYTVMEEDWDRLTSQVRAMYAILHWSYDENTIEAEA